MFVQRSAVLVYTTLMVSLHTPFLRAAGSGCKPTAIPTQGAETPTESWFLSVRLMVVSSTRVRSTLTVRN